MIRYANPRQVLAILMMCTAAGAALGDPGRPDDPVTPAPRAAAADDAVLYERLDMASGKIAGLSRALAAAVGDGVEYARLRREFDREMVEYQAASDALYGQP